MTSENHTDETPALRSPVHVCHDRVLGERIKKGPTAAGLYLPDNVKDDRYDVVVVAVGPGRTTDQGVELKPPCKVGDVIMFIPSAGIPFTLHGHTYIALDSSQIIGVVNKEVVDALEQEEKSKGGKSFFQQTKKPFIAG